MSQLVLIKNKNQCPQCAAKNSIRRDQRRCCECNTRLFTPEDDFVAIKQDWILSYWVFFPVRGLRTFRGWVHSTHLGNPTPNEGPLDLTKPGKDYGVNTAQARAAKKLHRSAPAMR